MTAHLSLGVTDKVRRPFLKEVNNLTVSQQTKNKKQVMDVSEVCTRRNESVVPGILIHLVLDELVLLSWVG